ncbi:MAG: FAD-binding protein [Acidobacteriota bacterium]
MSTTDGTYEADFQVTHRRRWTSWHEFEYPVKRLINVWNGRPGESTVRGYNATTRGFRRVIAEAEARELRVRAKGAGWSFSGVGTANGILLNARPLDYRFQLRGHQTHPAYPGSPSALAFVQCGNSIADLHRFLESQGRALPTSSASSGQTIAGAMSTGTHGAAIDVGAVQDCVRSIHLVVSADRSVWLERATEPAVADDVPAAFGADLVRDDALFDAALVCFGSFGVIHGLVIESTERFRLQAWRRLMTLDDALWGAVDRLDFSGVDLPRSGERPHHFQLLVNPYAVDRGVYVTTMYRGTEGESGHRPWGRNRPGDGALEVMGALSDIAPDLTPASTRFLIQRIYRPYEGVCGTPGEIFSDPAPRSRSASTAMGIPLGRVREALGIVLARIVEDRVPVAVGLRYVKASRGTLAFTRHGPQTCVLEIDGPRSKGVLFSYRRIWRELEDAAIPFTFHWGKINDLHLQPSRLRRMYGPRAEAWRAARRALLPTERLRGVFANGRLRGMGLAD